MDQNPNDISRNTQQTQDAQAGAQQTTQTSVSYTHLGTRFRVGTYLYTVESAETEEGVWCICAEEAGTGPSVSSGTALPVTYIPGLQSAVVTGIKEAGKEKEDETHFRDRVLQAAVSVRFGGNKSDYVAYAKTFEEIAYALSLIHI